MLKQVEQRSAGSDHDDRAWSTFDAGHLGPRWAPFRPGSDHPASPTFDLRPTDTSPYWSPPTVPRFASPVLVLIAAVSILEGYKWLNVVSTGGWQPSAAVFVSFAVPLAAVLARPRRDGRRVVAAKALVAAAFVMLTLTVVALLADRPPVTHLMGGSDLLFAVTALGVALANERVLAWNHEAEGTVPDGPRDQGPSVTVR